MVPEVLRAIGGLLWPLLLVWIVWRLGPVMREVMRERDVHAKGGPAGLELSVGGQPVSTQQAVDDQRRELEAVRSELSLLAAQVVVLTNRVETDAPDVTLGLAEVEDLPTAADALAAVQLSRPVIRRLLWVDDRPATNSYELAALRDRGIEVVGAASSRAALRWLREAEAVDAVVSDMHRDEDGETRPEAGLELLEAMRHEGFELPVVVYTSQRSVERFGAKVRELGGIGATATASELFELLGVNFGPRFAQRIRSEVQQMLSAAGLRELEDADSSGIDFVAEIGGRRIGIEVKAWRSPADPRAVEGAIRRLVNLVQREVIDEAWLVSAEALERSESSPALPEYVRLLTVDDLRHMQVA
jgi:CheY-like chemotaxis protein